MLRAKVGKGVPDQSLPVTASCFLIIPPCGFPETRGPTDDAAESNNHVRIQVVAASGNLANFGLEVLHGLDSYPFGQDSALIVEGDVRAVQLALSLHG